MHESKVDSLKEHDMVWKHFIFKELMFQKKKRTNISRFLSGKK